MSAVQASLFDVQPLVAVEYAQHESLDERFDKWLALNGNALEMFIQLSLIAQRAGVRRLGAKAVVEQMRWRYLLQTRGDDYKLNNSYTSRLAREAVRRVPYLNGLFEFREMKS